MGLFGQKDFNFSEYIQNELDFKFSSEKNNCKIFHKGNYCIYLYENKDEYDFESVHMICKTIKTDSIFDINFIPNSSIVTEGLIKQGILEHSKKINNGE